MNEFLFDDKPFDLLRKRKTDETVDEETSKPYLSDLLRELGKIRVEIIRTQKRVPIQQKADTPQQQKPESVSSSADVGKMLQYLEHIIREVRTFKPELLSIKTDLQEDIVVDHVKDLLPVIDSFQRVFLMVPENLDDVRFKSWLSGIRQIYNTLMSILRQYGVEEIPAIDLMFDPKKHAAVGVLNEPSKPNGIILRVDRIGLIRKGIIIRYPEVIVNQHK